MAGKLGSIGSIGSGDPGQGGLSEFDINSIMQALGQNQDFMHAMYRKLGIGVPSGDPAQAAASGQSLQYAGPGTAEQTDVAGLGNQAQAALGNLYNMNQNNPAIPGSFGNAAFNIQQQAQANQNGLAGLANQAFGQGFNNPPSGNTSGTTGTAV